MNIYHASWLQAEAFGMNAVIVAATEQEALEELGEEDCSDLSIPLIGAAEQGKFSLPTTIAKESL